MIGRLTGKIIEKKPPFLLLEVNGVGYELETSMNTLYKLPEHQELVTLHTHLVVREDAHILYGFLDQGERGLFRALLKANGVGPKLALTILSSLEPARFVQCVNSQDITTLVKVPGIGKKTAERLVVEMRDRLQNWLDKEGIHFGVMGVVNNHLIPSEPNMADAMSGLVALGYKLQEAQRALANVDASNVSSAELIRQALRQLAG